MSMLRQLVERHHQQRGEAAGLREAADKIEELIKLHQAPQASYSVSNPDLRRLAAQLRRMAAERER